jgi:hypothetical protein
LLFVETLDAGLVAEDIVVLLGVASAVLVVLEEVEPEVVLVPDEVEYVVEEVVSVVPILDVPVLDDNAGQVPGVFTDGEVVVGAALSPGVTGVTGVLLGSFVSVGIVVGLDGVDV